MIIEDNEDEVTGRLESPDNLINKIDFGENNLIIRKKHQGSGRIDGAVEIPNLIKEIAIEAYANGEGGTEKEIAAALGITQSTVSNSSRGLTHRKVDAKLAAKVEEVREKKKAELADKKDTAHERALDSLLESFNIVNEEMAAEDVTAADGTIIKQQRNLKRLKTATAIAKDLAAISGALTGREEGGQKNNVLIIEVPPQKQLSHYDEVVISS
jgi:transcriptional regulator with XRE-family HTH domain